MTDPLGPAVATALARARDTARRLGHDWVGLEHLLVVLSAEDGSAAAVVLRGFGADAAAVLRAVEATAGKGEARPLHGAMPHTPRLQRVLERLRGRGLERIGAEHLFLELLGEDAGSAAIALRELGLSVADVRRALEGILSPGPRPAVDEEPRALVEAILRKRLEKSPPEVPGTVELEVRSVFGPKGRGFQLWIGHRASDGRLGTEMAFWVEQAPALEEHFAATVALFEKLVRGETPPPADGDAPARA